MMFWTNRSMNAAAARLQFRAVKRAAQCAIEALELRLLMSVNVTTYHYDQSETGANANETILTPANVNVSTFGKLASLPTDGQVYAQPLVMTGVSMPGGGTEDLVFVATENDSVYAFDAGGTSTTPVWETSLLETGEQPIPSSPTGSASVAPIIGITGTPVIDATTNTLYCVGNFEEFDGTYQQRLYALNIATGAVVDGGPVVIAATVNGTGAGSSGGELSFNPLWENQRTALTLANGQVYIAFASHGDQNNYHGWVMAYNQTTLAQDYVWCNTPDGEEGGIWMSGGGLAVDSSGDLYLTSGNGSFDANAGGSDYGMALVKLSPSLNVLDYFSPYNQAALSDQDSDYGCGNAVLLPTQAGSAPDEALTVGKWGGIYLNNTDTGSLGEINNPPNGPNNDLDEASTGASQHNTFSYWNGNLYIGADGEKLMDFPVADGTLAQTPSSESAQVFGVVGGNGQGCSPTESSNGTSNAIVWVIDNNAYNGSYNPSAMAIVMAYNANNLSQVLWTSNQAAGGADVPGTAIQFTTPVVANGFVYVGTGTGVAIYVNHPYVPPPPPPPVPPPPPPGAMTGFGNFTVNAGSANPAGAPAVSTESNTLTLTTNFGGEASSAIYDTPVSYQNFIAAFTYTDTQGNPPADGFTFMLENDPGGTGALGGAGGNLGYSGITASFAVEFNIYQASTTGDALSGSGRLFDQSTGEVNLSSGDPINIVLSYNASTQTVSETLTDPVAGDSFATSYAGINLSSILGSGVALIGFTGGTGGAASLQTITNFSYFADPAQQVDLSLPAGSNFNADGIGLDGSATLDGGYDGSGEALSGTLMGTSQAVWGATPPQTFSFAPGNTPNTVISDGQTIDLPQGNYANISLVGSAVNGNQPDQTVTVNYTDGTSSTFTQSFSDWHSPQGYPGEAIAVAMAYDLTSTGAPSAMAADVYDYTFPTDPTLTVASITLPDNANLRVLAINVNIPPAVAQVSPNSGSSAGGTAVTIIGSGFTGATAVDFGSTPASSFSVYDDGAISATVPAGSGTVSVTVVTPAGTSVISPDYQFTYTTPEVAQPQLLPASDTGISDSDGVTSLNNATPDASLQFSVANTIPGATVTLYADGVAIGSAIAADTTTTVVTDGALALADGVHSITARQAFGDNAQSPDSPAASLTVETIPPSVQLSVVGAGDMPIDRVAAIFSEPTFGLTLSNLQLTQSGLPIAWTPCQTLTTSDSVTWILSGLSSLIEQAGAYQLTLNPSPLITDAAGNTLTGGASLPWILAATTTTLTAEGSGISNPAQSLTFTATVTGGVPHGEPVLLEDASDNDQVVASGTLSGGSATLTIPAGALLSGTHNLIAVYGGDANFTSSESAPYVQTVTAPPSLPSYITASAGAAYSYDSNTGALDLVSGTLTFTADNTAAPLISLTASGPATGVFFDTSEHLAGLALSGGAQATVLSLGSARTHSDHNVLVIGAVGSSSDPIFSIDSQSKLDLLDNDLIVHTGSSDADGASAYASVEAMVEQGRNPASGTPGQPDGQWNGNGLSSSAAASADASAGYEQIGLAVVVNSTLATGALSSWQVGSFNEPLDANDIIIKYDYLGDYALEGEVSADDAGILQLEYDNGATTGHTWATGSSLYDGLSDNTEAGLFQLQYGLGTGGSAGQQL